jgi:hypothetical protein
MCRSKQVLGVDRVADPGLIADAEDLVRCGLRVQEGGRLDGERPVIPRSPSRQGQGVAGRGP